MINSIYMSQLLQSFLSIHVVESVIFLIIPSILFRSNSPKTYVVTNLYTFPAHSFHSRIPYFSFTLMY